MLAADVLSRNLTREITGGRQTDDDFKLNWKLAKLVGEGKFHQLDTVPAESILKPYQKD